MWASSFTHRSSCNLVSDPHLRLNCRANAKINALSEDINQIKMMLSNRISDAGEVTKAPDLRDRVQIPQHC